MTLRLPFFWGDKISRFGSEQARRPGGGNEVGDWKREWEWEVRAYVSVGAWDSVAAVRRYGVRRSWWCRAGRRCFASRG